MMLDLLWIDGCELFCLLMEYVSCSLIDGMYELFCGLMGFISVVFCGLMGMRSVES